jgi:hypothetical protein
LWIFRVRIGAGDAGTMACSAEGTNHGSGWQLMDAVGPSTSMAALRYPTLDSCPGLESFVKN